MRKLQIVALTVAIAISAGSFSVPYAARRSETAANESAGQNSYEETIADLYARSAELSDEEILAKAAAMVPSSDKVEENLGEAESGNLMEALSAYEAQKADYITGSTYTAPNSKIKAEWDLQSEYSRLGFTEDDKLTTLIPGFTVTSCRVSEDGGTKSASVKVDEWMTQGYTSSAGSASDEDVSAYRYYFTANLVQNTDGTWSVASVSDTEENYAWLMSDDQQKAAVETEETAAGSGETGISSLKTYGAAGYTYSADKAIAYADKWATARNPKYKNYPGVDCANFVSQCLRAGGMPVNDKWYPASYAWVNCMGAISNFKKYGKFMKAKNSNVLKGNPVYYDWNSDGTYDHTAICVGKNSAGVPIVDAHTGDHYHATWMLGSNGTRATIQLRGSASGTSTSGTWKKVNGKWFYYGSNGKPVSGWLTYKNKQYYLSKKGRMVTGWKSISGTWYYFGKDGVMKTGWLKLGSRRFYLGSDGKMRTGWVKSGKKSYYMSSDGHAVTGWQNIGGSRYYFKSSGAMTVGISRIDGSKYYFDKNGHMSYGWVTSGGKKYFFSPSAEGKAATGYWDINGTIYYFNENGVLQH